MSLTGNPQLVDNTPFKNDGFWPDLMLADLLNQYRIPSEMAGSVIEMGLTMALIRVNESLEPVKKAMQDLSFDSLNEYTAANSQLINAQQILLTQYQHAVFARAKAGLLQNFKTLTRKPIAENQAKESEDTEQYWLDESQGCIYVFFKVFLPTDTVLRKANTHVVLL